MQLAQARTLVPPAAALFPWPGALQSIHEDLAPILQELHAAAQYVDAMAWAVDQELQIWLQVHAGVHEAQ